MSRPRLLPALLLPLALAAAGCIRFGVCESENDCADDEVCSPEGFCDSRPSGGGDGATDSAARTRPGFEIAGRPSGPSILRSGARAG